MAISIHVYSDPWLFRSMYIPIHGFLEFVTDFSFLFQKPYIIFFLENPKRRAPENDRDLSFQKLIWSHVMPFGVNSDPSFRAQKQRIRVRGCVFSYRRDSSEPGKNWKNRKYSKKRKNKNSAWNWGGLGVSGRSARTIRNVSPELSQDLVLLDIRKSVFSTFDGK